jgi:hypothetical protein
MSDVSSVDEPTSQSKRQWKSFSKNGNWDDASLILQQWKPLKMAPNYKLDVGCAYHITKKSFCME